jgi:tetratricopeptide (TPR) repeat protein
MDDYRAERFDDARDKFQQVLDQWGQEVPRLAQGSRARLLLAEGKQQMAAGRADLALPLFNQAQDLRVLDAGEVDALVREATTRASFASEVRRIEQALEQGRIGEARKVLNDQRSYTRTADEEKILSDLGARIADQVNQREIAKISEQVDRLLRENKRQEAINQLRDAVSRYGKAGNFQTRLDELNRAVRYEDLLSQAQKHEQAGRLAEAVTAYSQAQQIKTDAALEKRSNGLRAQIAYGEGVAAERSGDLNAARAAYTRALGFGEMSQATAALDRMKVTDQRASFVRAGDDAAAGNDFAAAINHYQNALKLGPDAAVTAKLEQVRLRGSIARVRQLVDQGDLAAAAEALAPLIKSHPDDTQVRELRNGLEQRQTYARHMDEGNRLRAQSRFGDAKREYLRARKIIDTNEVRDVLAETEYDHLIAQARDYMEARRWSSARGVLRAAADMRQTPLVQELLAKVNQEDPIDEEEPKTNR